MRKKIFLYSRVSLLTPEPWPEPDDYRMKEEEEDRVNSFLHLLAELMNLLIVGLVSHSFPLFDNCKRREREATEPEPEQSVKPKARWMLNHSSSPVRSHCWTNITWCYCIKEGKKKKWEWRRKTKRKMNSPSLNHLSRISFTLLLGLNYSNTR